LFLSASGRAFIFINTCAVCRALPTLAAMKPVDTFKHQGLRRGLIKDLEAKGITEQRVLDAIMAVPRHFFFDSAFLNFAYDDKAFPIGAGQTISQPYTVASQTSLLALEPGMKVLEVGTGSGYQAAVLAQMGVKVFSVERQRSLFKAATQLLQSMNSTVKTFYGDGYKGLPSYAPFDRILVTCGAPAIPEALLPQLKVEGIMVVPVGEGDVQEMMRIRKNADGSLQTSVHGSFSFVPMLPDKATERY